MKLRKTKNRVRKELLAKEVEIWDIIDSETKILNKKLEKGVKSAAVIGGAILAGYGLTKLLSHNKKRHYKVKKIRSNTKSDTGIRIASTVIKAIVPVVISKINEQINSNES